MTLHGLDLSISLAYLHLMIDLRMLVVNGYSLSGILNDLGATLEFDRTSAIAVCIVVGPCLRTKHIRLPRQAPPTNQYSCGHLHGNISRRELACTGLRQK
jgi:hypothetical protein